MINSYLTQKWIGTILFMCAGILVSSNISISKYAFFMFLTAHILYVYIFWKVRDNPMLANNIMFACVDIWGIYRWWF